MPSLASEAWHARYPLRKPRTRQQQQKLRSATSTRRQEKYGLVGSLPHRLLHHRRPWKVHTPEDIVGNLARLEDLPIFEVKRELRRRGCRTDGLKPALLRRLRWAVRRGSRSVRLEARPRAAPIIVNGTPPAPAREAALDLQVHNAGLHRVVSLAPRPAHPAMGTFAGAIAQARHDAAVAQKDVLLFPLPPRSGACVAPGEVSPALHVRGAAGTAAAVSAADALAAAGAGRYATCPRRARTVAWGWAGEGRLGLGSLSRRLPNAVTSDGRGAVIGEHDGGALARVQLKATPMAGVGAGIGPGAATMDAAAGAAHSLLLTRAGAVLSCGDGKYGQLGAARVQYRLKAAPWRLSSLLTRPSVLPAPGRRGDGVAAGDEGAMDVAFMPATSLPLDACVLVMFPPGFRLKEGEARQTVGAPPMRVLSVSRGVTGTFTAEALPGGNVYGPMRQSAVLLLCRRDKTGVGKRGLQRPIAAGVRVSVRVTGVINPVVVGPTGPFPLLQTRSFSSGFAPTQLRRARLLRAETGLEPGLDVFGGGVLEEASDRCSAALWGMGGGTVRANERVASRLLAAGISVGTALPEPGTLSLANASADVDADGSADDLNDKRGSAPWEVRCEEGIEGMKMPLARDCVPAFELWSDGDGSDGESGDGSDETDGDCDTDVVGGEPYALGLRATITRLERVIAAAEGKAGCGKWEEERTQWEQRLEAEAAAMDEAQLARMPRKLFANDGVEAAEEANGGWREAEEPLGWVEGRQAGYARADPSVETAGAWLRVTHIAAGYASSYAVIEAPPGAASAAGGGVGGGDTQPYQRVFVWGHAGDCRLARPMEPLGDAMFPQRARAVEQALSSAGGTLNAEACERAAQGGRGIGEFKSRRIVRIAAGSAHVLLLTERALVVDTPAYRLSRRATELWSWGRNNEGQLGCGERSSGYGWGEQKGTLQRVRFLDQDWRRLVWIGCGRHTSFALTMQGQLYSWGYGGFGEHGHGDVRYRVGPTLVNVGGGTGRKGGVAAAEGDEEPLVVHTVAPGVHVVSVPALSPVLHLRCQQARLHHLPVSSQCRRLDTRARVMEQEHWRALAVREEELQRVEDERLRRLVRDRREMLAEDALTRLSMSVGLGAKRCAGWERIEMEKAELERAQVLAAEAKAEAVAKEQAQAAAVAADTAASGAETAAAMHEAEDMDAEADGALDPLADEGEEEDAGADKEEEDAIKRTARRALRRRRFSLAAHCFRFDGWRQDRIRERGGLELGIAMCEDWEIHQDHYPHASADSARRSLPLREFQIQVVSALNVQQRDKVEIAPTATASAEGGGEAPKPKAKGGRSGPHGLNVYCSVYWQGVLRAETPVVPHSADPVFPFADEVSFTLPCVLANADLLLELWDRRREGDEPGDEFEGLQPLEGETPEELGVREEAEKERRRLARRPGRGLGAGDQSLGNASNAEVFDEPLVLSDTWERSLVASKLGSAKQPVGGVLKFKLWEVTTPAETM
eukprot:g3818.t1